MPDSFQSFAEQHRPEVEAALDQYTQSVGGQSERLTESIRYSLLAPGKRLRPLLTLMAARACGEKVERALPAAAAVEMVHAYSLIHDDLPAMDNDDLRRGRPTCHRAFDEATAILAGDALLTLAFETVAQLQVPAEIVVQCIRLLAEAAGAVGMVGGQADDIIAERGLWENNVDATELERLHAIHCRKTGAMIRVSLQLGAVIAGATPKEVAALESYGERLGLAFQITDDLLDVCGDEATTGKRVGKDATAGKLTFPGLLGVEQARIEAERLTREACEAVELFGEAGEPLASLSSYVLKRDHQMDELLATIKSPADLQGLTTAQLEQLAGEMREAMCRLVSRRSAHFASNLGVVELALALHSTFDFSHDRLIWDTGHQIYPHKMITGRYDQFHTIRSLGGLMGYPNPAESPYDLFMTGHAGCSVSTLLGLRCGDDLAEQAEARQKAAEEGRLEEFLAEQAKPKPPKKRPLPDRHAVAVIGDGAFPSGVVFEAMNNAGWLQKELTVVLNDNQMSICPRVGSMGDYLDRLRMTQFYAGLKNEIQRVLHYTPLVGEPMEKLLLNMKDSIKAGLLGGMLFEQLNFRYLGPVDGHNISQLQKYLKMARDFHSPVLLHVVTKKGHGFEPAEEDPTSFHAPAPFERNGGAVQYVPIKKNGRSYTEVMRDSLADAMERSEQVAVITAAMCQGNKLEPIREKYPDRLFDVGICESHAVAFAAGLAKTGMRPVVDIYSTFMQRSYDQIFQEMALQDLPVMLAMDRAGLVGPDGPTHHGVFDITYLRPFPNMVIMSPGDAKDLPAMVDFALTCDHPTAIRYPRASAKILDRVPQPIEMGRAETLREGKDGVLIALGPLVADCLEVAEKLKAEDGLEVGVINARFVKPLDAETILEAIREARFVVTVEEGQLMGGFGSAVLEAVSDAGVNLSRFRRLGVPDRFVQHGTREELLAEVGLDVPGILRSCREMAVAATSDL